MAARMLEKKAIANAPKRLQNELAGMQRAPHSRWTARPVAGDLFHWTASLFPDAQASPYAGGIYTVRLRMPPNYPFGQPEVCFERAIYHPNISEDGQVNISWLAGSWSAGVDICKLLDRIHLLLSQVLETGADGKPGPEPCRPELATLYQSDRAQFEANGAALPGEPEPRGAAKEAVQLHASWPPDDEALAAAPAAAPAPAVSKPAEHSSGGMNCTEAREKRQAEEQRKAEAAAMAKQMNQDLARVKKEKESQADQERAERLEVETRFKRYPFIKLKKFLKAHGVPAAAVDNCLGKFEMVKLASEHNVSIPDDPKEL